MNNNLSNCNRKKLIILNTVFFLLFVVSHSLFSLTQKENKPGDVVLPLQGKRELTAIAMAYPEHVDKVQIRDGDWALSINGIWYYWASGRFLTQNLRDSWEEYVSIRFYRYKRGSVQMPVITEELAGRLRELTKERDSDTRLRFNSFLDALYNVHSKQEADALMEKITFFNFSTRVHPLLVLPLARVEARITMDAVSDLSVKSFIDSLQDIHGYNWRNIAGTTRRSYHSYGAAVDLTHSRYKNWAYWRWAADSGIEEWWNIPINERHKVPQAVVEAFEDEGFVWGGKWLLFDNIHFEYRPEVLIMADRETE